VCTNISTDAGTTDARTYYCADAATDDIGSDA
jgi:hypothetical protein